MFRSFSRSDFYGQEEEACEDLRQRLVQSFIHQHKNTVEPFRGQDRKHKVSPRLARKINSWTPTKRGRDKDNFSKKYHHLKKIGKGGCSTVYAGVRIADSLQVAIKFIKRANKGCENDVPGEVSMMLQAGGTPDLFRQSPVVSLLEWFVFDHFLILVMERPENSMDLNDFISSFGSCQEKHMAKILIKQLLEAVIHIHSRGVVHRDLKSENILIQFDSAFPRIRIIDFGCSTVVQTAPYQEFVGTEEFRPPECCRKKEYTAEALTVWQVGAILYQMLHGYRLYTSLFLTGILRINRKLPKACREFLKSCLAKDPKKRATLQQLQAHPWLNLPVASVFETEMQNC